MVRRMKFDKNDAEPYARPVWVIDRSLHNTSEWLCCDILSPMGGSRGIDVNSAIDAAGRKMNIQEDILPDQIAWTELRLPDIPYSILCTLAKGCIKNELMEANLRYRAGMWIIIRYGICSIPSIIISTSLHICPVDQHFCTQPSLLFRSLTTPDDSLYLRSPRVVYDV